MESQAWSWTCTRDIPSDPAAGVALINEVLERLQENRWNDRDRFAVHLAMEEAVMNAIKHGNKQAPDKVVRVVLKIGPQAFYLRVTDQGDGFDLSRVPDPRDECNLELLCGRGVLLIKHYMDWVQYNECGNSVEMLKQRTSDG